MGDDPAALMPDYKRTRHAPDLTGRTFGSATVLRRAHVPGRRAQWVTECGECGLVRTVSGTHLRLGDCDLCPQCVPGQKRGRKPGPNPSYRAVHARLRRARGKATEHSCVGCGERADEWAYQRGAPDERLVITPTGVRAPVSADLDSYAAMCRSCHRRMDLMAGPRAREEVSWVTWSSSR